MQVLKKLPGGSFCDEMFQRKKNGPFKLRGLAAEQTGGLFLIASQTPYFLSLHRKRSPSLLRGRQEIMI